MSAERFIDSNIWLYALFEPSANDVEKHRRAAELILAEVPIVVSEQVIAEVCAYLLRRKVCPEEELMGYVGSFYRRCRIISPSLALHRSASNLRQHHAFSFWDSLIVAAALEAGCDRLYSEDMHHGTRIGDLTIVNPFSDESY